MKRQQRFSKSILLTLSATISSVFISGCALLPVEDVNRTVPTVAKHEEETYSMTLVTRTDIVDVRTINCNYSELARIDLSFNTGGKNYGNVYVSRGSKVKEGDLLATLDMGDLYSRLEALEASIEEHEKTLSQKKELLDLETEKINAKYKYGMITEKQKNAEIEKLTSSYSENNSNLEETLYLEKLEYETLAAKRDNSCIYAPMDGMISFVSSELSNTSKVSTKGKTVITLIDDSQCAFNTSTALRSYFNEGDIVSLTLVRGGTGIYDAVVEFDPTNNERMFLYPLEDITDLEIGARATLTLTIDSRENVLAVANSAIRRAKDFKYVYYINKDGVRDMKIVETGLANDSLTEIISGLEFGEAVIK